MRFVGEHKFLICILYPIDTCMVIEIFSIFRSLTIELLYGVVPKKQVTTHSRRSGRE